MHANYDVSYLFLCLFGQTHCAGLDARVSSLERQLADLQVTSEDEGVGDMDADGGAAPIVDSPPLPGAEEGLADDEDCSGEDDRGDGTDEGEEGDEETASDAE